MSKRETPLRRGLVLHALHAQYPMALTQTSLDRTVMPFYEADPRDFGRDLAYLRERKFILVERHEVGGREFSTYRLTATGVDIVERVVIDPGVEMVAPQ